MVSLHLSRLLRPHQATTSSQPVPALGVGQHVRWPRAHGRKGPNPSIYMYYVYSPTQKVKRSAGCQSNHHRGDGNLAKRPAGIGNLASRSRRTQRRGAPDSAPGSPSALGGRRLVWSGVSASRAGALGTGHRRHWFVVSRKELQALLYSSPSFVRSCLRPGRIRTPGNH